MSSKRLMVAVLAFLFFSSAITINIMNKLRIRMAAQGLVVRNKLYSAIKNNNVQHVESFLASGGNPEIGFNLEDSQRYSWCKNRPKTTLTPYFRFAKVSGQKVLNNTVLMATSASVCSENTQHRELAFHHACFYQRVTIVKKFLTHGVNPNQKGISSGTCLHYLFGLLPFRADSFDNSYFGRKNIEIENILQIFSLLQKAGAKILFDGRHRTPFHYLYGVHDSALIRGDLVGERSNLFKKDDLGFSQFQYACINGNLKSIQWIFKFEWACVMATNEIRKIPTSFQNKNCVNTISQSCILIVHP